MAKALANEAQNCSYIQVDRADLVSKWQGQSEKMVNALFNIATKNKPCIIFVDEIEGLLEDSDGGEGGSNGAKVVTVLLTAMQNLSKDQVLSLVHPIIRGNWTKRFFVVSEKSFMSPCQHWETEYKF